VGVSVGMLLAADSYKLGRSSVLLWQKVYNFVKIGQLLKWLKLGTRRHMQRRYGDITGLIRYIVKESRLKP
jgi:hypothetical protein